MRQVAFWLLQWTWGLPQNLAGLFLLLLLGRQPRECFHGAVITHVPANHWMSRKGCISMGMFIFVHDAMTPERAIATRAHEYGHCVQSLLFGPVFLLAVGIPSVIWAARYHRVHARTGIAYTSRYPEKNANHWGRRITGDEPIDW